MSGQNGAKGSGDCEIGLRFVAVGQAFRLVLAVSCLYGPGA